MAQVCLPPGWVTENGGICAIGNILDQNGFAVGCPDTLPYPVGAMIYAAGTEMLASNPTGPPYFPANYPIVTLPYVNYNMGGMWNGLNPNRLTAPVSGIYVVAYAVRIFVEASYRTDFNG